MLRDLPLVDRHHEEAREEVLVAALHVLLRPLDAGAVVRRVLPIVCLRECAAQRLEARARGNRSAADRLFAAGRRARGRRRRRQCRFRGGGGRGWPQARCSHRLGWGHGHRLGWSCRFGERSGGGRCGWPRAAEQLVWPIVLLVVRHLGLGGESQLAERSSSANFWGRNFQRTPRLAPVSSSTRISSRGGHIGSDAAQQHPRVRGKAVNDERFFEPASSCLRAPRACVHQTSELRPGNLRALAWSLDGGLPRTLRTCAPRRAVDSLSCRWSELLLPPLLGCASASPCALGPHPSGLQLPPCPSLPDSNGPQSHTRQRRTRKRRTRQRRTRKRRCGAARSSAATARL